jgi:hypothetical protein
MRKLIIPVTIALSLAGGPVTFVCSHPAYADPPPCSGWENLPTSAVLANAQYSARDKGASEPMALPTFRVQDDEIPGNRSPHQNGQCAFAT